MAADLPMPYHLPTQPASPDYSIDLSDAFVGFAAGAAGGLTYELTNANSITNQVGTSVSYGCGCSTDGFSFQNTSYDYFNIRTLKGGVFGGLAGAGFEVVGDTLLLNSGAYDRMTPVEKVVTKIGLGMGAGAIGGAVACFADGGQTSTTISNDVAFNPGGHTITGDGTPYSVAVRPDCGKAAGLGALAGATVGLTFSFN
ncbi:MAG: hypothetical protein P4M15_10560 [Alphaproteobacteria bacterium]|nr:hypothetical protein [Alphaproteobacteria bacterium]